jgi:hypothetical protein
MSLVGSLEDLGLGDILQIISLSRKSGVLVLRSDHGEGEVLFRDGRVCGAVYKGGPSDLRTLLVGAGHLSEEEFAGAVSTARASEVSLESVLVALPSLGRERFDALKQTSVKEAAFTMFAWPAGDFSFEVREEFDSIDPELCLDPGIDAQYLAMEGARLRDEADRDDEVDPDADPATSFADLGAELRESDEAEAAIELETMAEPFEEGDLLKARAEPLRPLPARPALEPAEEAVTELEPEASIDAAEVIALATAERLGGDDLEAVVELTEADAVVEESDAVVAARFETEVSSGEAESEESAQAEAAEQAAAGPRSNTPVVVVDPDLGVLEWAKAALSKDYAQVHIFQKTELAIARIRQYLVRRGRPLVLLAEDIPADPNSGARSPAELIERLRAQAPPIKAAVLADDAETSACDVADRVIGRPTQTDLHHPRRAPVVSELGERLRAAVRDLDAAERRVTGVERSDPMARLKEASKRLREAAPRGEIIPVVMQFAAEHFSRVAMFLVRDEKAVGMAGLGLEKAGGPDDAAVEHVVIGAEEPGWFRTVLAGEGAVRGAPDDAGDRALVAMLGDRAPSQAYVAPIESGERVVALLYADNLPDDAPLGDTGALELVLHEAGLALDRAALERQLAEVEQRSS